MRLDDFLDNFEFNEVHAVTIDAPAEHVFSAIKLLTPADLSPLIFLMLDVRNLPAKLIGKNAPSVNQPEPFLEQLFRNGFILLAEEPNREIVFGLVGQFWKLTGGVKPHISDPEAFLSYENPAFAKVAANLLIQENHQGQIRCSTETRIHVPNPSARQKFAFYWRVISIGSAFIRILWLKAIKRKAESK